MTLPLTAETNLDPRLHLVDFTNATPDTLSELVKTAINNGNTRLDQLEENDNAESVEQSLADVIAFDHGEIELDRSFGILSHLNSVVSNNEIRHAHHELLPLLSAYSTRLGQSQALFNRYQMVQANSDFFASLSQAQQRSIELAIRGFKLSGVALPADKQAEFAEISSQLSTLSAKFSDNVMDATQAFALPLTEAQLSGITDSGLSLLSGAGEQYKDTLVEQLKKTTNTDKQVTIQQKIDALVSINGKTYVATLDIPVYLAVMTYADNRDLRAALHKAYTTRASEFDNHFNAKQESLDNSDTMSKILDLRLQKAKLLDMESYAELSLSRKMADSVEQIEQFLRELADKAKPAAKNDLAELAEIAPQYGIANNDLQPWDRGYLAEKVKQAKFSLSQEEIRPYFPLPKVVEGLFAIVEKLYSIKVVEHTTDVPLWFGDVNNGNSNEAAVNDGSNAVTFYQLYNSKNGEDCLDNQLIGGFYFDFYARQGKRGGAWMSGFQSKYINQDENYEQLPVCFMVGNFTPANTDDEGNSKPSLLTHDEVTTLFHEFGHGLHHLLTEVDELGVSGINGVEWDAVELPSQFMENWAWDNEGIALISGHVDTGEPLPTDKLQALQNAKNFQSGMQTLRQVEFSLFDLLLHYSKQSDYQELLNILDVVRADIAITDTPEYDRFANGFSHIFAGGYACGYYSYKWAELLSADAFSKFEEQGIFNQETGQNFRDNILAVGGSRPAKENFEKFRGREATVDALLRHCGFIKA